MRFLRKILYPFSLVYGEITAFRNRLYDRGILKSTKFDIPVIVVGNLSVGGTGKTPQVEYLVRLLQNQYRVAILSRGYKRKTKGFVIADDQVTSEDIGDEPMQYFKKFKGVTVAVDADRVHGITQLIQLENPPDVILLDDAFQHRKVQGGLNILLTPYNDLYIDDVMLPTGNLREKPSGASRAQIIVVTKGPNEVKVDEQSEIANKLKIKPTQALYFSYITYGNNVIGITEIPTSSLQDYEVLLVTGIAKTVPLEDFLRSKNVNFTHLKYKDHHDFTHRDVAEIQEKFNKIVAAKKLILTTEKDYVRSFAEFDNWYYLPIMTSIVDRQSDFDKSVLNYVNGLNEAS
ncbi:tetraacyldisaccharide 4'-kinase [Flavobacteriaceae bacterium F08102]|nr:tetraacyldisaccharide 4'-kinase [Flavobacteriaceae bacterium F08102]